MGDYILKGNEKAMAYLAAVLLIAVIIIAFAPGALAAATGNNTSTAPAGSHNASASGYSPSVSGNAPAAGGVIGSPANPGPGFDTWGWGLGPGGVASPGRAMRHGHGTMWSPWQPVAIV